MPDNTLKQLMQHFCESVLARIDLAAEYSANRTADQPKVDIINPRTGECVEVPEHLKKLIELREYVEFYLCDIWLNVEEKKPHRKY